MNAYPTEEPQVCVVLDANVWVREMLLNSSIGAAFLYRLDSIGGLIGLPQVTKLEVIKQIEITGMAAVKKIENNMAKVRSLIGESPEIELPSDCMFRDAVSSRLAELDDLIINSETTPDHYRKALDSVISGTSPNATREQYRDSLVWEAVLDFRRTYPTVFITGDADFYQGKKFSNGLASDLRKQLDTPGNTVTVYENLESYLQSFKDKLTPDYESITAEITNTLMEMNVLQDLAREKGFTLGNLDFGGSSIQAFITERRSVLALRFKLAYQIFNVLEKQAISNSRLIELEIPNEHREARLVVAGNCYFDGDKNLVLTLRLEDMDSMSLSGQPIVGMGVGYMSASIGEKNVSHRVERSIDDL